MLIDSNVLIYAINTRSPKHGLAKEFLVENSRNLHVAHQNILETIRVLTHTKFAFPMKIKNAIEAIEGILRACTVISPDYRTHQIALRLIAKYKLSSNHVFDAYLVATALSNSIDTIATDNIRDFKKFTEIKVINPFLANVTL